MSSRASAFQYAKGLFSVAVEGGDIRATAGELESFSALVSSRDDLRQALTSAAIPPDTKQRVVGELLKLSPVAPLVRTFLLLLARHDRLSLLPAIVDDFNARVMRHLRVERAEVTTALPIDENVKAEIARSLSAATGRQVRVTTRVDTSIVAGVVARVGSLVFDGSVRRRLERIREHMIGEA